MKCKEDLYEPVLNFRENKPQMQIRTIKHDELYEKAFFTEDNHSGSEYTLNTTAWD